MPLPSPSIQDQACRGWTFAPLASCGTVSSAHLVVNQTVEGAGSDHRSHVAPGTLVGITISIANTGSGPARGVTVADVLPAGFMDTKGNVRALHFDTRSILMEASRRQDEWRRIRTRIPTTKAIYRLSHPDEPKLIDSAIHIVKSGRLKK